MAQPNWIESPELWNTVILGPAILPGVCVVTSEKGRDVDFKKSPGQDGGTDTDKGSTAGEVTIVCTFAARQWEEWVAILPHIDPNRPGATTSPLDIRHPEPNSRGIRSVRVLSISGNAPTARGGKSYTIKCREWFPAPKPVKTAPKKPVTPMDLRNQPTRYTSFLMDNVIWQGGERVVTQELRAPEDSESLFQNTFGSVPVSDEELDPTRLLPDPDTDPE